MADNRTVVVIAWEIVNLLHMRHTDKMYLSNKIQEAINLKVEEKDTEIERLKTTLQNAVLPTGW